MGLVDQLMELLGNPNSPLMDKVTSQLAQGMDPVVGREILLNTGQVNPLMPGQTGGISPLAAPMPEASTPQGPSGNVLNPNVSDPGETGMGPWSFLYPPATTGAVTDNALVNGGLNVSPGESPFPTPSLGMTPEQIRKMLSGMGGQKDSRNFAPVATHGGSAGGNHWSPFTANQYTNAKGFVPLSLADLLNGRR